MARDTNGNNDFSEYLTLESECRGVVREKMSKFIAIGFPVESAADAKEKIKRIANDYHDARHVCWAYIVGASGAEYQSNDNGEPSGTAGRPILGQIRSAGLTYVAVAVVRYFGGIKLGTSGLIDAYKEATRAALESGSKVVRVEEDYITIAFSYSEMESVMRILKNSEARITNQAFDLECLISLAIRKDRREELLRRLDGLVALRSDVGDIAGADDVLND